MSKQVVLGVLAVVALVGCGKKNEKVTDAVGDAMESSLNAIAGAADDASGETVVAEHRVPGFLERAASELAGFSRAAWASSCTRSFACDDGIWTRNVSCDVGQFSWEGTVQIDFYDSSANHKSGSNCNIGSVGDSLIRKAEFTRSGRRGSIQTTASAHTDYRGNEISGGSKLTRETSGFSLDVLGVSKILRAPGGEKIADVSLHTLEPVSLSSLQRADRTVDGGALEVIHNVAQFVAVHRPSQVKWSADCCYPVAGTVTTTFEGSIAGTSVTTFKGCGEMSIEKEGETRDLSLENCE